MLSDLLALYAAQPWYWRVVLDVVALAVGLLIGFCGYALWPSRPSPPEEDVWRETYCEGCRIYRYLAVGPYCQECGSRLVIFQDRQTLAAHMADDSLRKARRDAALFRDHHTAARREKLADMQRRKVN
jgi:hypothetical protein